jgi:hypothetical protein
MLLLLNELPKLEVLDDGNGEEASVCPLAPALAKDSPEVAEERSEGEPRVGEGGCLANCGRPEKLDKVGEGEDVDGIKDGTLIEGGANENVGDATGVKGVGVDKNVDDVEGIGGAAAGV